MPTSGNIASVDDLVVSLLQRWRVLVGVTVVVLGLAVGLAFLWPTSYAATATLTVEPLALNPAAGQSTDVNMETERAVATSSTVLGPAAAELGGITSAGLAGALQVSVPKGAQVLEFTVTLPNGDRAAAAANAIAGAYSDQRVANAERVVDDARQKLTERIVALEASVPRGDDNTATNRAVSLQIIALQESLATLSSATFSPGTLVGPATTPLESTRPSLMLFIVGGLFLGVLVGSFAALGRARYVAAQTTADDSAAPNAQLSMIEPATSEQTRSARPEPRGARST